MTFQAAATGVQNPALNTVTPRHLPEVLGDSEYVENASYNDSGNHDPGHVLSQIFSVVYLFHTKNCVSN